MLYLHLDLMLTINCIKTDRPYITTYYFFWSNNRTFWKIVYILLSELPIIYTYWKKKTQKIGQAVSEKFFYKFCDTTLFIRMKLIAIKLTDVFTRIHRLALGDNIFVFVNYLVPIKMYSYCDVQKLDASQQALRRGVEWPPK